MLLRRNLSYLVLTLCTLFNINSIADESKQSSILLVDYNNDLSLPNKQEKKHTYKTLDLKEIQSKNIKADDIKKIMASQEANVEAIINTPLISNQRKEMIEMIRNKYQLREITKHLYPKLFYKRINLEQATSLDLDFSQNNSYILKPCIGFFGLGVKKITRDTDLKDLVNTIKHNITLADSSISDAIDTSCFVIESNLRDDQSLKELAVDMYFDEEGKPNILGMFIHPIAKNKKYSNLLYYTNSDVINRFYDLTENYFLNMSKKVKLKNISIHAEFFANDNYIVPIEMNPLRFGGFGLEKLPYFAYKIDSRESFFQNKKITKEDMIEIMGDNTYSWFIGYLDSDTKNITINFNQLNKYLGKNNIINIYKVDYKKYPVFAIYYLKHNKNLLNRYLKIDFKQYVSEIAYKK
jgi:hypothetical protein